MRTIKIMVAIGFIFLQSCYSKKSDRYIPLSGGDIPTFLDTETKEVYSIQTYFDSKPVLYKTSLNNAIAK